MTSFDDPRVQLLMRDCENHAAMRELMPAMLEMWEKQREEIIVRNADTGELLRIKYTREEIELVHAHFTMLGK